MALLLFQEGTTVNEDPTLPADREPDPADGPTDAGDEDDRNWGDYQLDRDDRVLEEAGYGHGV